MPAGVFFPYLLLPNSPGGRFRAIAPNKNDTYEYTARIDHQITSNQRIYGRWVMPRNTSDSPDYKPSVLSHTTTWQHSFAVNYTNALRPNILLTASAGYLHSDNRFTSPNAGIENLVAEAGVQGIPTASREAFVGLPNVGLTGYTGFGTVLENLGRSWYNALQMKWERRFTTGLSFAASYSFAKDIARETPRGRATC